MKDYEADVATVSKKEITKIEKQPSYADKFMQNTLVMSLVATRMKNKEKGYTKTPASPTLDIV